MFFGNLCATQRDALRSVLCVCMGVWVFIFMFMYFIYITLNCVIHQILISVMVNISIPENSDVIKRKDFTHRSREVLILFTHRYIKILNICVELKKCSERF